MQDLNDTPGSRDIVLYDALPNSLPRVGGIITSVIQTPLSHVNLRAIQDNVPNAYIANPLDNDAIANLLGGYVYYKVENEQFEITRLKKMDNSGLGKKLNENFSPFTNSFFSGTSTITGSNTTPS